MFKKILFSLAIIVIGFLALGLFLSGEYSISRSIQIQTPIGAIFEKINILKENEKWRPSYDSDKYNDDDPKRFENMNIQYNDIPAGKGASYSWSSPGREGSGTFTITESQRPHLIQTNIYFKDMDSHVNGKWTFVKKEKGSVYVEWSFEGKAESYGKRYWALLVDSFVGHYLERGLNRLKEISEVRKP